MNKSSVLWSSISSICFGIEFGVLVGLGVLFFIAAIHASITGW